MVQQYYRILAAVFYLTKLAYYSRKISFIQFEDNMIKRGI